MQRVCTICGEEKPAEEYRLNSMTGRYSGRCLSCPLPKYHHKYSCVETYLRYRYHDATRKVKGGSKSTDCFTLEYVLDLLEKQNGRCAVTGKVFTFEGNEVGTNVSIDRIDSNKPYSAGNVRLVCSAVNYMKRRMNDNELVDWCLDVVKGAGSWK